jgi:hypothetical protein
MCSFSTRDYDVILPLMASAGVASLVADVWEEKLKRLKSRDRDDVSWGDLSDRRSVDQTGTSVDIKIV